MVPADFSFPALIGLLGGLVDVATVIAPAADLLRTGGITAALAGGLKFALGLLLPFIVWGASVGVGLWIGLRHI